MMFIVFEFFPSCCTLSVHQLSHERNKKLEEMQAGGLVTFWLGGVMLMFLKYMNTTDKINFSGDHAALDESVRSQIFRLF